MRRKKGTDDAPATGARITPEEVQQVEFRLAFRGYNERDVDAFLDRITEGLSSYLEELERMRLLGQHPQAVTGSIWDAGEMVARARAEADEIVRRAHEQAAGIRAAAGTGSGDTRGVVAPFLNREREFLQSLGGLVQTHDDRDPVLEPIGDVPRLVEAARLRLVDRARGRGATRRDGAHDPLVLGLELHLAQGLRSLEATDLGGLGGGADLVQLLELVVLDEAEIGERLLPHAWHHVLPVSSGRRAPNKAVPIRTIVAPSSTATG